MPCLRPSSSGSRRLVGGCIANYGQLGSRVALQLQGNVVKAGLAFVVDPDRTLLVALEAHRAERARQRSRRRRRRVDRNSRRARSSLTLIVNHVCCHRNRSRCRTSRAQRGRRGAAGHRTSRSAIAIGQRTILRTHTARGNRRGISRSNRRRIRRAARRSAAQTASPCKWPCNLPSRLASPYCRPQRYDPSPYRCRG